MDGDLRPHGAGVPALAGWPALPARPHPHRTRRPGLGRDHRARVAGRVWVGELFQSYAMLSDTVEEAREMGGLLIVAVWMGVLALVGSGGRGWRIPGPGAG